MNISQVDNESMSTSASSKILKSPYEDIKLAHKSLIEFIWKDLNKWKNKVAIQSAETNQIYTYSDLRTLCARFAKALKKEGFRKGQVLAIVLPNTPQFIIALMGAMEAGLIVTTLNPNFTTHELSRQLADCRATVIVTLNSLVDRLKSAAQTVENNTKVEHPITLITLNEDEESSSTFEEMINERNDDGSDLSVEVTLDDVALLPYSSGTTGLPKGVQLTHSNLLHSLIQLNHDPVRSVQETTDDFQEIVPAVLPFYHIFGISALILTSLVNGCKIITMRKFHPEKYADLIKREKATVLYLVPALASFITSYPNFKPNDLDNVRISFFAGSSTPINDMQKLISLSGNRMRIRHAYGMTEASPGICQSRDTDPLNSVGVPLPGTSLKIVNEDGRLESASQIGEIYAKGPQVMKGYLNDPKATAKTIDKDGFLHTGDAGYYDDKGNVFYVDRIKELIKVKGFQVSPVELESVIKELSNVKDVGVIGMPDERSGEKPVAFVVAEGISEEDLKQYVASQLSPYKRLARVIFVDKIPRNQSGKVLRGILREEYADLLVAQNTSRNFSL